MSRQTLVLPVKSPHIVLTTFNFLSCVRFAIATMQITRNIERKMRERRNEKVAVGTNVVRNFETLMQKLWPHLTIPQTMAKTEKMKTCTTGQALELAVARRTGHSRRTGRKTVQPDVSCHNGRLIKIASVMRRIVANSFRMNV